MSEELLRVEAVSKAFGGVQVLQDVSLSLRGGEVLALVGANGAGKSTLIKVICGAHTVDKGAIYIDGRRQAYTSVREAVAAGIAVAHQHNMTISSLTGAQNIELGREPTRFGLIDKRELRRRAEALWRAFDVDIDIDAQCGDLGPGEQKIVDILKALATDPRILILDEPTATLTLGESKRLFSFIERLKAKNIGVIFISHHLQEVLDHCDSVVVLKDGRLVHQGVVDETLSREDIVQMMIGRSVVQEKRAASAVTGEKVASVKDLTVANLHVKRFEAARGEVVGIAGLIGAGQSEFLQCLAGARRPAQAGSVELFSAGLPKTVGDAVLRGIYSVPADRIHTAMFGALTVEENLSSASLAGLSSRGFVSARKARARAADLISQLAIKCAGQQQKVQELSGGNQQKVSFARWLSRPGIEAAGATDQIFLLDNPTEGVDVGAKAEFYDLIARLAARGGTIIVTSAEFTELIAICDRIYCIRDNRLCDHFPAAEMTEEALLLKTN